MNARRCSTENKHHYQDEIQQQSRTLQSMVQDLQDIHAMMKASLSSSKGLSRKQRQDLLMPVHNALSKLIFIDNSDVHDEPIECYLQQLLGGEAPQHR